VVEDLYDFLEIPYFYHKFKNLKKFKVNDVEYNDNFYGRNLHDVKSHIEKSDYKVSDILPENVIKKYSGGEFWRD